MTERATIFERLQIGAEATNARGTSVSAGKLLPSLSVAATPNLTTSRFRPQGRKLDTLVVPGQRWTAGTVEGRLTYNEIIYPLASLLGNVSPTTPGGATNAREWSFAMSTSAPATYRSYTMEVGSSTRAAKFTHGVFTDVSLDFSPTEIALGGSVLGQKYTDGISLTSNPSSVALMPVDPNDVTIYVDSTAAALGTTAMSRVFAANLSISGAYGPVWTIDASEPSWASLVETAPDATLAMTFAADATGMGFLSVFEDGATRYVRIEATGPEIETGQDYLFRMDLAVKCEAVDLSDQDGVLGAAWTMRLVDDADVTGIEVLVRNKVTAL